MKFGSLPLDGAEGAIAAHAVRLEGMVIKKGTRLGADEIAALRAAGYRDVVAAQLEEGDLVEDAAAMILADAVAGAQVRVDRPFTGRSNLYAACAGVLRAPRAAIDAFNGVDEAITLATPPDLRAVAEGELIGTVKVIPYAVPEHLVAKAAALAPGLLSVTPFRLRRVAVVFTLLPGLSDKVTAKTLAVTQARLVPTGAQICHSASCAHEVGPLRNLLRDVVAEGAELVIVFGASAIVDRRDVVPSALVEAGGQVIRLGMPVDPGNLLLLGRLGDVPVLGAPGCARSPKENGFDWVLTRLLAGIEVTSADIARLGAGGLLADIPSRPSPRGAAEGGRAGGFAAVVLAAGRSSRMGGGVNKLLARVGGVPVIRRVVEAVLGSRARPVLVVTGHDSDRVAEALEGLPVQLVHNADYGSGMASSLAAGIAAVPEDASGALVVLGDMPLMRATLLDRIQDAYAPEEGRFVVLPVSGAARGHPVLWSRRYFPELMALKGDVGARHLLVQHREAVAEIDADGEGAFLDVDTPEALARALALAAPRTEDAGG
ncbi:NTP transferase domain-containing protein [Xanthobacter agilis]|uniref:Molybdenum cofactor cytidylyltransferase n=1 Tax=Xanthobacter agilis TaxID=47492 RepID=A0ABU0LA92_XANAG|nr:molybdopterin-binding/glycosyltransferase family 2 protein [Xanthobacter agilis]MDQ0504053.1 molybdenum cofactor cytidylyltransferase [Xanthobacter agilis]